MIKSLLNSEDEEPGKKKTDTKKSASSADLLSITNSAESTGSEPKNTGQPSSDEPVVPFEVSHPIGQPDKDTVDKAENELESKIADIEELIAVESKPEPEIKTVVLIEPEPVSGDVEPDHIPEVAEPSTDLVQNIVQRSSTQSFDSEPESAAETMRKSGLAYSAAIALFGSVVFMLIMGWFADLLLGIGPWGTVIGISIGAIIGFLQLFRITSKIVHPKPSDFDRVSLLNREDDFDSVDFDNSANSNDLPEQLNVMAESAKSPESTSGAAENKEISDTSEIKENKLPE